MSQTIPQTNAVVDEEQRQRKLEKKEVERIAKRFKVITPAEFERNLAISDEKATKENRHESGDASGDALPSSYD